MKQKKIKIIIGVLLALVMFASSIALLMYSKQSKLNKYVETHIEVYIAARPLQRGDIIGENDIKISSLPKSYIGFTPLTKSEIVGRYAIVDILETEPMRPEKISDIKPVDKKAKTIKHSLKIVEKEVKQLSSDTIAVSLKMFRNIDNSLKKGDFIDIVSVKPKSSKKNNNEYTTKYIALHVAIDSFVSDSKNISTLLVKKYDEDNKVTSLAMADSIVFEISPKDVKNFLSMYYTTLSLNSNRVNSTKDNRGHLWMVKCASDVDEKIQKEKERLLVDKKTIKKAKRRVKKNSGVIISYEK